MMGTRAWAIAIFTSWADAVVMMHMAFFAAVIPFINISMLWCQFGWSVLSVSLVMAFAAAWSCCIGVSRERGDVVCSRSSLGAFSSSFLQFSKLV